MACYVVYDYVDRLDDLQDWKVLPLDLDLHFYIKIMFQLPNVVLSTQFLG